MLRPARAWPLLVLVAVTLGYFRGALSGGSAFFFRDFSTFIYPTRRLLVDLVRAGELPLWNPLAAGGAPIAANPEYNLFYPLTLVYYLLPFDPALTWYVIGHYPLLGGLFYLLARRWGLSPAAALAGAVTLMLSGPALTLASVPNYWPGFAWLPLTLLAADHYLRDSSWRAGLLAAGSLGLQALGDPQMVYFTLVALGLQALLAIPPWSGRAVGHRLVRVAAIAAAAGILSAVQLVPLAELYLNSERRGGLSLAATGAWSLPGHRLLEVLYPRLLGDPTAFTYWGGLVGGVEFSPWLLSPYVGLVSLALVAVALSGLRAEPGIRWLGAILLVSAVLALGQATPAHALATRALPLYGTFRYPEKWWVLVAFAVAGLTAWGAEIAIRDHRAWRARLATAGACLALAFLGLTGGALIAGRPAFLGRLFPAELDPATRSTLVGFVADRAVGQAVLAAGWLSGVAVLLALAGASPRARRWVPAGLVLLIVLDLGSSLGRLAPLAPVALHRAESPLVSALDRSPGDPLRVFVVESQLQTGGVLSRRGSAVSYFAWLNQALFPNAGFRYGLSYERGGGSARLEAFATLAARFDETGGRLAELALWNTGFVIAGRPLQEPALVAIAAPPLDPPVFLYRYPSALPRAWLAASELGFADRRRLLAAVTGPAFDPRRQVLLETSDREGAAPSAPGEEDPGRVQIVEYRPTRIRLDVKATRDAVVVVSDAFYPGWAAAVDGRSAPLLRANYAMRAVRVPAGRHRVELVYRPWSVAAGLAVSLAGLGLLGLALARGRRSGPPEGQGSTSATR